MLPTCNTNPNIADAPDALCEWLKSAIMELTKEERQELLAMWKGRCKE